MGFSADVRKTHKRLKVAEEERGLLLFILMGQIFFYKVCHFGGSFSAYWWSRVGALLLRLAHRLVWVSHTGFLYVDDFLWRFARSVAPLLASLVTAFLEAVGCPLSWKKLRLGVRIKWIGLRVEWDLGRWVLPEEKLVKIRLFLQNLSVASKSTKRKALEAGTGLLLWVSMAVPVLRPWLAEF